MIKQSTLAKFVKKSNKLNYSFLMLSLLSKNLSDLVAIIVEIKIWGEIT